MKMKSGTIILIVVVALVLGFIIERNKLVREKESVSGQWSQIDTELQRRSDLIPNLVETVKGYAKEETSVVQSVANARAALGGARTPEEKGAAYDNLNGALGKLLVVVENYPNLKADQNFRALQFELAGSENRIDQARRRYNDAVKQYNTDISLFPANVIASMGGFERQDYFKTQADARTVPKVQF